MAKDALAKAKAKGVKLLLPVDNILADNFAADAKTQVWDCSVDFPADWQGLDIGPKSIKAIEEVISTAKTIVWNGPAGVFEFPRFAVGTNAIARAVAANRTATSIIGGGDSVSAPSTRPAWPTRSRTSRRAAALAWSSLKARSCRAWKR